MHRYKILVVILFLSLLFSPLSLRAASSSLVISEIQTASTTSTGQEFIELYNPTSDSVVVDGWILQYKSATSAIADSSWTKRAELTGSVPSHGFYLISQTAYLSTADTELSTGLSGTGGHVRLKDNNGIVVDLVGWGTNANAAEASPAPAPAAGESIERLPGRLVEDGGNITDTDDNSKDFILRPISQPQSAISPTEEPALNAPINLDDPLVDDRPAEAPATYAPIIITELMPDPAAPLTDAHDEFIELYNPNEEAVNLKGYTLRAGSNFHSFYILPELTIAPGGYLVVYAKVSRIGLTNTGGAAQLLDPAGNIVSSVENYGQAETGQSWSLIDGIWKWSMQATPGIDNVFVAPPVPTPKTVAATVPKPKTASSSTKAKATSNPKSTSKSAAKTTKTAAAKVAKPKKAVKTPKPALVASATNRSGSWLLITLAAFSIGYAIYEFRYDVRNYYHITKRYLKARGGNRPPA
jgi:hypothetical protein